MKDRNVKKAVRKAYGKIASAGGSCCKSGCGCSANDVAKKIGYGDEDFGSAPAGSNLGLGCGNPVALASLKEGETVLDLGSGAGFDCFLAAKKVGTEGEVIGVDMTPEMVKKAKDNAARGGYKNVEFLLGEIEDLPVEDSSIDAVISNCVINLSTDKDKVFREIYRVLAPGGRFMVSDIVLLKLLPEKVKESIGAYIGCIAGAATKDEYVNSVKKAGFKDVEIVDETSFPVEYMSDDLVVKDVIDGLGMPAEEIKRAADSITSIKVYGKKPSKGKSV